MDVDPIWLPRNQDDLLEFLSALVQLSEHTSTKFEKTTQLIRK